jgi:ABC-type branched-subunit amino acid transport system ATPase component
MKILQTKNLVKRFDGVHAVDHLSIHIEKGTITGIIGPNGSGKTTLLNLLSGVLPIDSGEIIVEETEKYTKILPHQVYFYGITRTFQNVQLFEQMTVLDNILVVVTERSVFRSLFEKHTKYHLKKAEEVLQKIGLWEKRNQLAVNLSYGQRKLLEIARTLATQSEIYLFDEPFAGLFPEMRKIVSGIIQELKQENKTIILIEHDMSLIRALCDYIFVMDDGKLLAEGKPERVLEKKEVIEAYLGE